jgi:hypothetical protein
MPGFLAWISPDNSGRGIANWRGATKPERVNIAINSDGLRARPLPMASR